MNEHGSGPVTETAFAILISVSDRPRHGYAIMKQVRALSSDRIRLSTGTLYGALKRFLDRGWIARVEETGGEPASGAGRRRKAYVLTRAGGEVVSAEAARLSQLAAAGRRAIARAHVASASA